MVVEGCAAEPSERQLAYDRSEHRYRAALNDGAAPAHGYVTLYGAGRISLSGDEFKALVRRSMRRLYHGLKA